MQISPRGRIMCVTKVKNNLGQGNERFEEGVKVPGGGTVRFTASAITTRRTIEQVGVVG